MHLKSLVLAAGKGTRLQSESIDLPKVMREALGRPLLHYVLDAISFIENEDIIIVVGYKKERITAHFPDYSFAVQTEQLGTGHAVLSAKNKLEGYGGALLVCCGDMPLIKKETYLSLIDTHFRENNACTILSGTTSLPLPYGRIIRDEGGDFLQMVEEKDCSEAQRAIMELNSGVYVFDTAALLPALSMLRRDNTQGEYYLTDIPRILRETGHKVGAHKRDLGSEIIGVNTVRQLEQVENLLGRPSSGQ